MVPRIQGVIIKPQPLIIMTNVISDAWWSFCFTLWALPSRLCHASEAELEERGGWKMSACSMKSFAWDLKMKRQRTLTHFN